MSLPRDLKVTVPGAGTNKINAAYEIGGPRKTVATIKQLFEDATGEEFPINHVISVSFGGFRRAVNYVDGVYVDIDRRYYNDNTTAGDGEAYATIDVQPGYQRLKGQDALDYVRYRHFDNDFFRASRQQDFLRQITHQDGVRALLDVGKRKELARVFGRYFEVDDSFVEAVEPDRAGASSASTWRSRRRRSTRSASRPTRPRTRRSTATSTSRTPTLRKTFDEFMTGKGSSNPRRLDETTKRRRDADRAAGEAQEEQAVVDQGPRAGARRGREHGGAGRDPGQPRLPVLLPGAAQDRLALRRLQAAHLRRPATPTARSTRPTGWCSTRARYGEYYGVQGLAWKDPPILDDPDRTRTVDGRKLMLYYDGSHLRLVAWRTQQGGLLGHEHADAVDPEQPPDRDRRLAAAPEDAKLLTRLVALALLAVAARSSPACGCPATRTR